MVRKIISHTDTPRMHFGYNLRCFETPWMSRTQKNSTAIKKEPQYQKKIYRERVEKYSAKIKKIIGDPKRKKKKKRSML